MKKWTIFKGFSAFAIATVASVGLVNASENISLTDFNNYSCSGLKGIDYYLFLEAETTTVANGFVNGENTTVTYNTNKKNLQKNKTTIVSGPITLTTDTSTDGNYINKWSTSYFYTTLKDAYSKGTDGVYSIGTANYIAHSTYYDIIDHSLKQTQSDTFLNIYNDGLGLSSLISNSVLPATTFIVPSTLGTSDNDTLEWGITRDYAGLTIPSGVSVTSNNSTNNFVFAPAGYFVAYCDASHTISETENYTITYDANGGANAPASQTATTGTCLTISSEKPTLKKNNFLGWSTDPKATEADSNYAAGSNYCDNKDITLYAVWQTQTGIADYSIIAGVISIITVSGLYLIKKKNIFKQI